MLEKNLIMRPSLLLTMLWLAGAIFMKAIGQENAVTGVVTDGKGEPLIGVNIVEKGKTNGTVTDYDGKYTLSITGADAILSFSYIGFDKQDVKVGNQKTISVTLKEQSQNLEEVVVIGYGTAKKKDLTGAIASVQTTKMEKEAPRTVQDLLRGSAAGLSIKMSTDARGTSDLQIRGKNTLTAGSGPLLVLDGVIYQGAMEDINPNDIQSIDVLKDASSAAVYGAKAASGVIAITTKKGSKGSKPTITFNTNLGFAQTADMPKVLDADGFLKFRYDFQMGNTSKDDQAKYPAKFVDPRKLDGTGVDKLTWYNYTQKTPATTLPGDDALTKTWLTRLGLQTPEIDNYMAGNITDWDDVIFQTGFQQDYTVSLSNRTDRTSYYWSVGYVDREGTRKYEDYTNFRTRLNLETKVTNFLSVGVNAAFNTRDNSNMPRKDQDITADEAQRTRLSPFAANDINDPDSPYRCHPAGVKDSQHPLYNHLFIDLKDMSHFLNANLFAKVSLPLGIEYEMNFTPYYQFHETYWHQSDDHEEWAASGGKAHREYNKTFNWMVDNIVRWKHTFNKDHKVEVTLLANAEKDQSWQTVADASQFSPNDNLTYHSMQTGTVPTVSSNDLYKTGDALMGRLFYSYKDKYMLTTSIRRDGYSAFGQDNPHASFPSVALGWVFTSEKFMKSTSDWFNYGKLRLSWGKNGNRDIPQYDALSNLKTGKYPYIDQSGNIYILSQLYVDRMANKYLKWEGTAAYNFGLDFSLFNVISGSMDAYVSETQDLLVKRVLPEITGFKEVMANMGKLKNKGFELTLNANPVNRNNFSWNTSGNFSFNRRKLVKLYGTMTDVLNEQGEVIGQKESDDIENKWFIGQDPDRIWDYERNGVWQEDEEDKAAVYGNKPGDFKYVDQDGNGVLDNKDKKFQGYKTPRFRWSWRNEFTFFKDFNLAFSMYSLLGQHDTYNYAANGASLADKYSWFNIKRWTPDNPTNDYARLESKNLGSNYVSKSFIRFDNVTLSYNVPKELLKKISVQNMRFSLSVKNVGEWSPNWEFGDPEVGNISQRTYNLGINFTL